MDDVLDLDIIRPKTKKVKLAGKTIDVSFVPCGITFEVDEIVRKMANLDPNKIETDVAEARKGFDLAIDLCVAFASIQNPEFTKSWFLKNCSPAQLNGLADVIKVALYDSYKGLEQYGKN